VEPGRLLANRYQIVSLVGSGGAGLVYKAVDTALGEVVAIKTLKPEVLATDPHAIDRLLEEIRLARRISHRNVVRTHDLGEARGVHFITMEYVEGTSLRAVLRARGRLPPAAVLSVAKQLLRALEVAHEQGILHRDIKPQNLLLGPSGVLKVSDFGIARLVARRPRAVALAGAAVGTPEYMAPEQLLGQELDARADIYAAGIVLHECLTGATPFQADTPMAFFAHKLGDAPRRRPPARHDVPRAIEELVARMTSSDREARPASAGELHDLFARIG
jgi:serine/threonine-protein kinase